MVTQVCYRQLSLHPLHRDTQVPFLGLSPHLSWDDIRSALAFMVQHNLNSGLCQEESFGAGLVHLP